MNERMTKVSSDCQNW